MNLSSVEKLGAPVKRDEAVYWRDTLAGSKVPLHLRSGLVRYFAQRIAPGSFLMNVLENQLAQAVRSADLESRHRLCNLVDFLWAHAPIDSWGSPETVETWLRGRSK